MTPALFRAFPQTKKIAAITISEVLIPAGGGGGEGSEFILLLFVFYGNGRVVVGVRF